MIELQKEVLRDHFVPEIRVISGGITAEMSERSPRVSVGQRGDEGVTHRVIERDSVEVYVLGLSFVDVVRDGAVAVLRADPAATSEGGGAVHAGDQFGGNGLAGFVVAGELGQDLWAGDPLFEHLRRG